MLMNKITKYSLGALMVAIAGSCSLSTKMDATIDREVEATTQLKETAKIPDKALNDDVVRVKNDIWLGDSSQIEYEGQPIPPSIESEVVDYEEEIKENDTGMSNGSGEYNAEDPVEDWLAEEGQTLKDLLTEWSERAGWRLIWNSNRNYTLTAGAMFRGRFADVSSALIRAFARARPAPIATFYKGNRVLVVETMEDENAYE